GFDGVGAGQRAVGGGRPRHRARAPARGGRTRGQWVIGAKAPCGHIADAGRLLMRRAGLPLALAGLAACAGHQPPSAPRPAADTVAARPAPPPSPIPIPPPAPVRLLPPARPALPRT